LTCLSQTFAAFASDCVANASNDCARYSGDWFGHCFDLIEQAVDQGGKTRALFN